MILCHKITWNKSLWGLQVIIWWHFGWLELIPRVAPLITELLLRLKYSKCLIGKGITDLKKSGGKCLINVHKRVSSQPYCGINTCSVCFFFTNFNFILYTNNPCELSLRPITTLKAEWQKKCELIASLSDFIGYLTHLFLNNYIFCALYIKQKYSTLHNLIFIL